MKKHVKILAKYRFDLEVKYGVHSTNFHETRNCSAVSCGSLLYRI